MKGCVTKSFLLALALVCGCEAVVRVFFARNMSGRFEYGYHPTAGVVEPGDGTVRFERAGGRRFHPQQLSARRPEGVFRVMVVGDSVPRGPSLQASYAMQLAGQLRARGVKAECVNLAVPGYGARRCQLVLKQALRFEPSLVILHLNNSNEYEDEREWRRAQEFRSWHPRHWLMKPLVLRRLHEMKTEKVFWEWLPAEVRNQREVNDADAEVAASMNEQKVREWDELVAKTLAEDVVLCRATGVPVLVLARARFHANEPLADSGLDAMARAVEGPGVSVLSMKEALAALPFQSLFADSAHLRREGHEALARAIAEAMERGSLLPAAK
jgi:hypothetical protein